MEVFLSLSIVLIALGSFIITFIAIIKIISNDFNGSKAQWILISMIAFIGPILWLIKGRKLIIEKKSLEFPNTKDKVSLKNHYSELIKNLPIQVKFLILVSITLIFFGYFVRLFNVYFFWESKSIGYGLLLIMLVKLLLDDIYARKEKRLNRVLCYIGMVFLCFTIFMKGVIAILLPNSDAYKAATELLKNNSNLISEVGEIHSFSFLPTGSMGSQKTQYGTIGDANLTLIIKGKKKYVEKNVILKKESQEDWTIVSIK